MKPQWIKQFTRENTLLDRSLRTLAYCSSVQQIWRAPIIENPVVGQGDMITLYYKPFDYTDRQQKALQECINGGIAKISTMILSFFDEAFAWSQENKDEISRDKFQKYFEEFKKHHMNARGAIVYGYWGAPAVSDLLKKKISLKIPASDIDSTLSILSLPHSIYGSLASLYTPSEHLLEQRKKLIKKLKFDAETDELVDILSWCTLFYEVGERLATYLYDSFTQQLRHQVDSEAEYEKLQWYDPESLADYFKGKKLSDEEIARRKKKYILEYRGNKVHVTSGSEAEQRYHEEFEDTSVTNTNVLKGTIASSGKARGRACIVLTERDQAKMQQGDILISTMTTPRLMAACQKAGAIVTDEGGITTHAAIVAREFKIPCIVGTKNATETIKDGDIVEVDATRGIVRVLERAQQKK